MSMAAVARRTHRVNELYDGVHFGPFIQAALPLVPKELCQLIGDYRNAVSPYALAARRMRFLEPGAVAAVSNAHVLTGREAPFQLVAAAGDGDDDDRNVSCGAFRLTHHRANTTTELFFACNWDSRVDDYPENQRAIPPLHCTPTHAVYPWRVVEREGARERIAANFRLFSFDAVTSDPAHETLFLVGPSTDSASYVVCNFFRLPSLELQGSFEITREGIPISISATSSALVAVTYCRNRERSIHITIFDFKRKERVVHIEDDYRIDRFSRVLVALCDHACAVMLIDTNVNVKLLQYRFSA